MEAGLTRCGLHELGGVRKIEIDQLTAIVADGVVVAFGFAVVAARAITKFDFVKVRTESVLPDGNGVIALPSPQGTFNTGGMGLVK